MLTPGKNTVQQSEGLPHTQLLQEDVLARLRERQKEVPHSVEIQIEQAHLLAELKQPKEAAEVYRRATSSGTPKYPLTSRAYNVIPYRGKTLPITVLLLVPPAWGNAPFRKYLDDQIFLTLQVIADFHDPGLTLPPQQLVVNCISDADLCQASLKAAQALMAQTTAPVVNPPAQVLLTGREVNAQRLASIPGVRTPKIATFPREFFEDSNVAEALGQSGFTFPFLLRATGYHTGLHFIRVENLAELVSALPGLPGDNFSVIEFLVAPRIDDAIRKYRVMAIDGTFYPAHVAISKEWKVHYFSAAMAELPEHRAEDQAFLDNMPHVLGAGVMETLGRLHAAMKLDYWGIDFSIGANGKVLLYEANATMQVQPPDADEIWAYRRAPVQRITDAIRTLLFQKPFAAISPHAPSLAHILREAKFRQLEDHLKREPERVDLDIERARLLIEMDRLDEAKQIYLNILLKDPSQFVALNNLGALLNIMGYHKAALKVYRDVVAQNPESPKARVNLAHNLRESCEMEEARAEYETVLQKEPNLAEAHEGLAHVLMYLGDEKAAWEHHKKSARKNTPPVFSPREEKNLTRVIVLASPCGGNSPIVSFLNKKTFHTLNVIPDFYDPSVPLPPHDLILNAIGDADHCRSSLKAAERILLHATQPVLNLPARIRTTGREDNARLLGNLEGVVTPRITMFPHDVLAGGGALYALDQHGFTFPLLLRRPGFHEGSHFLRVENPSGLKQAVSSIPGQHLLAIQYLDARDTDGKIRKYRVMMIDGRLYPLHKAISSEWMIHYFSAEMTESAAHRAEDEAFLEDMPAVLGPRAMRALELIRDTLGLDYAGADFSLGPNGEVFLFEANATMSIPLPEKDARWDYRRRPVQKIHTAVREMILTRAGADGAGNISAR